MRRFPPMWPLLLRVALAVLVTGAIAAALRFGAIETDRAALCGATDAPGWCEPRGWLVWLFFNRVFGLVAVAGGVVALLRPRRWSLTLGAATAGPALMLYNVEMGAAGLLLVVLGALRASTASR